MKMHVKMQFCWSLKNLLLDETNHPKKYDIIYRAYRFFQRCGNMLPICMEDIFSFTLKS